MAECMGRTLAHDMVREGGWSVELWDLKNGAREGGGGERGVQAPSPPGSEMLWPNQARVEADKTRGLAVGHG